MSNRVEVPDPLGDSARRSDPRWACSGRSSRPSTSRPFGGSSTPRGRRTPTGRTCWMASSTPSCSNGRPPWSSRTSGTCRTPTTQVRSSTCFPAADVRYATGPTRFSPRRCTPSEQKSVRSPISAASSSDQASSPFTPKACRVEILEQWAAFRPSREWCDPSVETRERRSRADRLIELGGGRRADLTEWLEALVLKPTLPASRHAILVAAACVDAELSPRAQIERARIAMTDERELVEMDPDSLFLPSGYGSFGDIALVHAEIWRATRSCVTRSRCWESAGSTLQPNSSHTSISTSEYASDEQLDETWALIRSVGYGPAAELFREWGKTPWVKVKSWLLRAAGRGASAGRGRPRRRQSRRGGRDRHDLPRERPSIPVELGAVSAPQAGGGSTAERVVRGVSGRRPGRLSQ